METIIALVYFLGVLAHAVGDSIRTKRRLAVDHMHGTILYGAGAIIMGILLLIIAKVEWYHLIALPLTARAAWFDPLYNVFIGKNFLYEGVPKPMDKESWWDRQERKIGLPTVVYRVFYLLLWAGYLFVFIKI